MKFKLFYFQIIQILLFLSISVELKSKLDFSYYHTSEQIDIIMNDFLHKGECKSAVVKETLVTNVLKNLTEAQKKVYGNILKYFDITSQEAGKTKQNVFLLAGEHPREMIAVETMLNFIEFLCSGSKTAINILSSFNFRIILNANPLGRLRVEQGEYCKRTNDNDVDINRNWDIFWGKDLSLGEENPGKGPFSEVESFFIKESIKDYNAKMFLTVHSGVYGLYTPYAYLREEGKLNYQNMFEAMNIIKKKYCPVCQLGPPSKLIGYKSSGTCLDYIYDNYKVPYALAWEIYTDEIKHPSLVEIENKVKSPSFLLSSEIEKNNNEMRNGPVTVSYLLKNGDKLEALLKKEEQTIINNSFFSVEEKIKLVSQSQFQNLRKASSKNMEKSYSEMERNVCVNLFNPLSKEAYKFIVTNWRKAMIELLNYIKNKP
jgi:hypothetical protein